MRTFSLFLDTSLCDSRMLEIYIINNKLPKNILLKAQHPDKTSEYSFSCTDAEMHHVKNTLATGLLDFYLCGLRQFYIVSYAYAKTLAYSGPLFDFFSYKLSRLIYSVEADEIKQLYNNLVSALLDLNRFSVDGFFRFGMRNAQATWHTLVDRLADNVAEEVEYSSPITIRRTFPDLQKSMVNTLHLFANNGDIKIFDDQLNNYDPQAYGPCTIKKVPFCGDNLTLCMLFTLAPVKLVIHGNRSNNSPLIKLIKLIFARRICSD